MSESTVNNKRIAKNTIYLYLRMLFVMLVGLYTVRAILDILGEVDYGLYNVVGGVVTMFAFMNRTLSTSSQRYFSIEIAKGDKESLHKWFSLNITTFGLLGLIIALFLETVGLWFLNTQMTIPSERMMAANVVYQLSIISFLFHIVSVPYLGLIIAHEKMHVFAYVGILEALGRLVIVFILTMLTYDKLIIYGILILLLSLSVSMSYMIYCWRHYPESSYRWYWNPTEAKELLGFSGWHFLGTFSTSFRGQGINILLNLFFNPAVNAARAVAFQVNSHIMQLSSNFFTAIKPQIYKSYAKGELDELFKLIMRGTIISTFLISIIAFPFYSCTSYLLGLWLKEVPAYTVIFTKLAIINGLIDCVNGPLIATSLATGRIRNFMIIVSLVIIANVPISYIALLFGADPTITMIISIIISYINVLVMAYLLKLNIGFPWVSFVFLICKTTFISFFMLMGIQLFSLYNYTSLGSICVLVIIQEIILVLLYGMVLSPADRKYMVHILKHKILNKNE